MEVGRVVEVDDVTDAELDLAMRTISGPAPVRRPRPERSRRRERTAA